MKESRCEQCRAREEEETEKLCRFCLEGEDAKDEDGDTLGPLMQVCPCKGSQKYVHHECLVKWFQQSGRKCCPTCQYEVNCTEKIKPWSKWKVEPIRFMINIFRITFYLALFYFIIILFAGIFCVHILFTARISTYTEWVDLIADQKVFLNVVGTYLKWIIWVVYNYCLVMELRERLSVNMEIVVMPYDRNQNRCHCGKVY